MPIRGARNSDLGVKCPNAENPLQAKHSKNTKGGPDQTAGCHVVTSDLWPFWRPREGKGKCPQVPRRPKTRPCRNSRKVCQYWSWFRGSDWAQGRCNRVPASTPPGYPVTLRASSQPYLKQALLDWPATCTLEWLSFYVGVYDLINTNLIMKEHPGEKDTSRGR